MRYIFMTEYFPESENVELTGGVESRVLYLVKELAKKHDVTVLCSRQREGGLADVFGARVIRCGPVIPYSNKGHIIGRLILAWDMYRKAKSLKADVVEGSSFIAYIPAFFAGKKIGAKKIATWHETWIGEWVKNKGITGIFGGVWERISIRLSWDRIIAVSDFTKSRLKKHTGSKIIVIKNGIDTERFEKIKATKHKDVTVCYFGRVNWQKRIDILIEALAGTGIRCVIIGDGPALGKLKRLASGLDIKATFTGRIRNHEDMLKEAKRCHIYASPSTLEGFGITVLEAMALGLPYVISDIEPFKEVTEGKGGLFFRKNDYKDLRKKLIKLINERPFHKKKKEAKELLEHYRWKELAKRYDIL